jgi:hypothetical protein
VSAMRPSPPSAKGPSVPGFVGVPTAGPRHFARNHRDAFYDRIVERLGREPFYQAFVARIQQEWPESERQGPAP